MVDESGNNFEITQPNSNTLDNWRVLLAQVVSKRKRSYKYKYIDQLRLKAQVTDCQSAALEANHIKCNMGATLITSTPDGGDRNSLWQSMLTWLIA
jgi:hypothetical protein